MALGVGGRTVLPASVPIPTASSCCTSSAEPPPRPDTPTISVSGSAPSTGSTTPGNCAVLLHVYVQP